MNTTRPDIGKHVDAGGVVTNYLEAVSGSPVKPLTQACPKAVTHPHRPPASRPNPAAPRQTETAAGASAALSPADVGLPPVA